MICEKGDGVASLLEYTKGKKEREKVKRRGVEWGRGTTDLFIVTIVS